MRKGGGDGEKDREREREASVQKEGAFFNVNFSCCFSLGKEEEKET